MSDGTPKPKGMTRFAVEQARQREKLTHVTKAVEQCQKSVDRLGERLDAVLLGDGSVDKPGMIVDVDRLKQSAKRRNWTLRAVIGAMLTFFAERLFTWIRQ